MGVVTSKAKSQKLLWLLFALSRGRPFLGSGGSWLPSHKNTRAVLWRDRQSTTVTVNHLKSGSFLSSQVFRMTADPDDILFFFF